MVIESIQVLNGPNVWSIKWKKLIQMRLDLVEMEDRPTNTINGFLERIESLLPSLYEHECSEGKVGGFFERVRMGTWMGHVVEHIALEIQTLAGMNTGFGRTRETNSSGTYNVIFSCINEEAGVYSASAAVNIAQALIDGVPYELELDIENLRTIFRKNALGPSTKSIVDEAVDRDIPWMRLNNKSFVQLGYGINQRRIEATITDTTSYLAVTTACDKGKTKTMLRESSIPVAAGGKCVDLKGMRDIIKEIGFPIVVKPLDGNQGKGATINVSNIQEAKIALNFAKKYCDSVIVEKYISGFDFRILVVGNKVVAAAKRIPAHVIGNGVKTILELIEETNKDPRRGMGHENVLTKIVIDSLTLALLSKSNMNLDTVPNKGEIIYLKSTANLSTGATSIDVTKDMHIDNVWMAERISRVIGLDICGIDIMAPSLDESLVVNGGVVLEVNAAPGFRMHLAPSKGVPRNVAASVVDMLYPKNKVSRIPIIAITGTNGKTTTTRLIAHIVRNAGYITGFTTSDGIYIQDRMVEKGDTTGPVSASYILKDSSVEFAVLETARGGIIRSGLAFDLCDIGIITNIKEDHLGLKDVNTLEDLTRIKSVVVETVKKDGWAILNGEDPYCLSLEKKLNCNTAYFALNKDNAVVRRLIDNNKVVAVCDNGYITILKGEEVIELENIENIPLTMDGNAKFMIENVLAASLATYLFGFDLEGIRNSLRSFIPGPKHTPGRLNVFAFQNFNVMIDFAHNPPGFLAIEDYLAKVEATKKIGIIAGVGDRRDEDIIACGRIAARMFDHIIIRQERHLRGRTDKEIEGLLLKGIGECNQKRTYEIIPKELEAIEHAISIAEQGNYIVALCDVVSNAIDIVQSYLDKEQGLSRIS